MQIHPACRLRDRLQRLHPRPSLDLGTRVREGTQLVAAFRDDGEILLLQGGDDQLVSWYFEAPS